MIPEERKAKEINEYQNEMRVKGRLNEYRYSLNRLEEAKEKQKDMIYSMLNCKAIVYDDMPRGSRVERDMSDQMVKLENIEKLIEIRKISVKCAKKSVLDMINSLPADEQGVMIEQYINLKKWDDISKDHHISKQKISKLSKSAIKLLGKKMKGNEND